jgi:IMP and pyridine-specific 5'-nucleotidase
MKSMLQHSFVLDALDTTGADTFSHFELLVEEHRSLEAQQHNSDYGDCSTPTSRLKQLVPTVGRFFTHLPLRLAFEVYNQKHRLTKRKHIQISFNECRHILNLAQIIALRKVHLPTAQNVLATTLKDDSPENEIGSNCDGADGSAATLRRKFRMESIGSFNDLGEEEMLADLSEFNGPRLICFDGDQTLYSDGQNFERNPRLAFYLYQLLRHGVTVAVVTAAGYEYMVRRLSLSSAQSRALSSPRATHESLLWYLWYGRTTKVEKYEYRLSGLLHYFQKRGLALEECQRFYLFGGECNYLLQLHSDYRLHPVREHGPGGWMTATQHLGECPANWAGTDILELLDAAQSEVERTVEDLNLRGRVIRKYRSVGLVPRTGHEVTRESLDETVLRVKERLSHLNGGKGPKLPYCAFNGGSDAWVDAGNKRVGVQVLQSYLGIDAVETLHIGTKQIMIGLFFLSS